MEDLTCGEGGIGEEWGPIFVNGLEESLEAHLRIAEHACGEDAGCGQEDEFWVDLGGVVGAGIREGETPQRMATQGRSPG